MSFPVRRSTMNLAWDEEAAQAARQSMHPDWDWGGVDRAAANVRLASAAYRAAESDQDSRVAAAGRSLDVARGLFEKSGVPSDHPAMKHLRVAHTGWDPDKRIGIGLTRRADHLDAALGSLVGRRPEPAAQEHVDWATHELRGGGSPVTALEHLRSAAEMLPTFHPALVHIHAATHAINDGDNRTALARMGLASRKLA